MPRDALSDELEVEDGRALLVELLESGVGRDELVVHPVALAVAGVVLQVLDRAVLHDRSVSRAAAFATHTDRIFGDKL